MERLAEAIDELHVAEGDGEALATGFALLDRLAAKLSAAVAAFEASGRWADDGATSMTAWLRRHAGMTGRDAAAVVRTARSLSHLPATRVAWETGTLAGGQVKAVVANLRPGTLGLFTDAENDVLPLVRDLSVADTASAMRHWARCAEAVVDGAPPAEPRGLDLSTGLDGSVEVSGRFAGEGGAVVCRAVRLASTPDVDGEPERAPCERRADALVDVCRFFLDHQRRRRGGRHRPHLNVVVDLDALDGGSGGSGARLVDGPDLDAVTVDRLLCDSAVHRVVRRGRSVVLDYGTSTRTVPAPLWAALVVRDEHCRFPGCDRPAGWCEAHHVVPVTAGGPTRLTNLALLCTRHHHLCHAPGWRAELRDGAELVVTTPTGRALTSRPPASLGPPSLAPPSARQCERRGPPALVGGRPSG